LPRLATVFLIISLSFASTCADTGSDIEPRTSPVVPRPGYLERTVDPVFGTTIIRITDSQNPILNPANDPSLDSESWEYETGHGYSSRAAWNLDQSLLLMEKGTNGMVFLDGASYEPLFRRTRPGDVRWDPINPEVMIYINRHDHCVGAYKPRIGIKLWERCFSGYNTFEWSDPGKGKSSIDGNIVPIRAQRSSDDHWVAILYYIDSDSHSDEIDMTAFVEPGDTPDFVMSPKGDTIIVVGCLEGHTGRCEAQMGVDVATKRELWRTNYYHDPGHADESVDADGRQWRIGVSKEGVFKGHIIKRDFRTGQAVSLIPYWGSHTSTRGVAGTRNMAIVTYQTSSSDSPLKTEIVGVCLDGSCLERYAHTHRYDDCRYLAENHASVSPLGDKIVFRSNWDVKDGPIDAFVIEALQGTRPRQIPKTD